MKFKSLNVNHNPNELELSILNKWKEEKVFQQVMDKSKDNPNFVFYEGPPTANGSPHYGHILTRSIKDLFLRYKTMKGFFVKRKAGWDTHGLPVEVEVEKLLKLTSKSEIEKYGVDKFIEACKSSVWKYQQEWEQITERTGYWLDLKAAYVTYTPEYVDSLWWIVKQLHQKGLLKKSYKILPWCPTCQTGLSAAEVAQGYKEVTETSATIAFRSTLPEHGITYFLAWTTTPWTLPGNVALVVNPDVQYGLYKTTWAGTAKCWVAVDCAEAYGLEASSLIDNRCGRELAGLNYDPLFPSSNPSSTKFNVIVSDSFVTTQQGTGIVHAAPAFGEDDHRVCQQYNLGFVQPVDPNGHYNSQAPEFLRGKHVKKIDKELLEFSKHHQFLFRTDKVKHEYPHCWRTDNPLIYYAREAWFLNTTSFAGEMQKTNQTINWLPSHIKDGRFGQFLKDNRDWNVSRERYWATPLPVWVCSECKHLEVVGSRKELQAFSPADKDTQKSIDSNILDPHRPHVDSIVLRCPKCSEKMFRDPSVMDCWFDSGAMPIAQWGFPHLASSDEEFSKAKQADFICEAIDQTRGWFYTLHVISNALFGQPAFKNCLVLGHVLDKDGKKLSKKNKNYTPPQALFEKYGVDSVRWFFYRNMGPGASVKFDDALIHETRKEFVIKLLNIYQFFQEYANIDGFDPFDDNAGKKFPVQPISQLSYLDRWIVSRRESLIRDVTQFMESMDFQKAASSVERFVEDFSNWYVRRSRERAWSNASPENQDKWDLWYTYYDTLLRLTKLLAPFIPFLAEELHTCLTPFTSRTRSVHLGCYPEPMLNLIDPPLESQIKLVQDLVSLGKRARAEAKIRTRQPLRLAVILPNKSIALSSELLTLVKEELNVKEIQMSQAFDDYVERSFTINWAVAGKRLRTILDKNVEQSLVNQEIRTLKVSDFKGQSSIKFQAGNQRLDLLFDENPAVSEVLVKMKAKDGYSAADLAGEMVLVLDTKLDQGLRDEAAVTEIKSIIQGLRKDAKLAYDAKIRIHYQTDSAHIRALISQHAIWLKEQTLALSIEGRSDFLSKEVVLENENLKLGITEDYHA